MDFLMQNLGNIIVGLVLIIIVFFIVKSIRKNKGSCSGCSDTACPHNPKNKTNSL